MFCQQVCQQITFFAYQPFYFETSLMDYYLKLIPKLMFCSMYNKIPLLHAEPSIFAHTNNCQIQINPNFEFQDSSARCFQFVICPCFILVSFLRGSNMDCFLYVSNCQAIPTATLYAWDQWLRSNAHTNARTFMLPRSSKQSSAALPAGNLHTVVAASSVRTPK